jgi:hypothetical protein
MYTNSYSTIHSRCQKATIGCTLDTLLECHVCFLPISLASSLPIVQIMIQATLSSRYLAIREKAAPIRRKQFDGLIL